MPEERQRWFAVKIFERDERIIEKLNIPKDKLAHIENDIKACETEMDDDSQSIITAARYTYIASIIDGCVKKSSRGMSTSDKIDRVLTNRILGLPIFAAIMTLVYYIAISTVGTALTLAHTAPTPVGMVVHCDCELTAVEDRRLHFTARVYDDVTEIAAATHERYIVDNERFTRKANSKLTTQS